MVYALHAYYSCAKNNHVTTEAPCQQVQHAHSFLACPSLVHAVLYLCSVHASNVCKQFDARLIGSCCVLAKRTHVWRRMGKEGSCIWNAGSCEGVATMDPHSCVEFDWATLFTCVCPPAQWCYDHATRQVLSGTRKTFADELKERDAW